MKKYSIIYADPPWSYGDRRKGYGGAKDHYQTMKVDDICNLPIQKITAENAALFLWVTFPNLPEGLEVMKAWGFKYKTLGFSWIKINKRSKTPVFGIGHYTKSNCEVCLLGLKGKLPVKSHKISSVVISPREEHSKKPDIVREKIVELFGDLPRIELFARQPAPGWDVWGNEVQSDIIFTQKVQEPEERGSEHGTIQRVCGNKKQKVHRKVQG